GNAGLHRIDRHAKGLEEEVVLLPEDGSGRAEDYGPAELQEEAAAYGGDLTDDDVAPPEEPVRRLVHLVVMGSGAEEDEYVVGTGKAHGILDLGRELVFPLPRPRVLQEGLEAPVGYPAGGSRQLDLLGCLVAGHLLDDPFGGHRLCQARHNRADVLG